MPELQRFSADVEVEAVIEAMRTDGAAIVEGVLDRDELGRLDAELTPWIERSPAGRDDFTGRQTSRTGALVARSEAAREVVMNDLAVSVAEGYLEPYTSKIQLHLTQVIRIGEGQGAQPLHRDRLAWGGYIPREIEPQLNTIWAMTDFTTENGATRTVPGSVSWPDERRATEDEICQAEMSAGSVLFYSGSVIHSGGENRTAEDRIGINITYCLGWLRTEENQFLSCPPEIAKDLDPRLQEMLGYTMPNYALGYFSDPTGSDGPTDLLPPELAIGRYPTTKLDSGLI